MADPVSIAKMREAALSRIVAEAGQIAAALDLPAPTITTYSRDRAYLEMARLTDVADWLETVSAALKDQAAKPAKSKKSKADERVAAPVDTSEPLTQEEPDGTTTHL